MTDRPIIFSAPMVRALLDGRKTQTRRILKKQDWPEGVIKRFPRQKSCVPYAIGDRLWVREAWSTPIDLDHLSPIRVAEQCVDEAGYAKPWCPRRMEADGALLQWSDEDWPSCDTVGRLRPSIHMPRWASRLTLHVTDVRVQRLQEISEEDAQAEGVERVYLGGSFEGFRDYQRGGECECPSLSFETLWNSLHGPDAWDANPWVVAVSFTVEHCNIDQSERSLAHA